MSASLEPTDDPVAAPRRRVLLVDDEPVIRFALRRFFHRQGWIVDEAADGHAALARLLATHPDAPSYDVVISDLWMPGLSGIELHARLERERPEILRRLILSTGDAVSSEAAAFLARASCPVLSKPFELADLRAMLAELVAR
jgi:CheY-like chemotaxis protein